ncbi:unnamed protein product [Knipowitschia caucasica]
MKVQCVGLMSRPGNDGVPGPEHFQLLEKDLSTDLEEGEVLVRTLYLSVDPYMRCRMNHETGAEYLAPWPLHASAEGGGVGEVVRSRSSSVEERALVTSFTWPWQTYAVMQGERLQQVDPSLVGDHVSYLLGAVGMPGLTSLFGVRDKGHVTRGQTMVVSGAAGACGSIAGQIGRLDGCSSVVGICGSSEKCKVVVERLGFTAAINYREEVVEEVLKRCCPQGVHLYFDNVGGAISDDVIAQMCVGGRVVLCGQISQYNRDVPYPPPLSERTQQILRDRTIVRERFMVLNYSDRFRSGLTELSHMVHSGDLQVLETVVNGIENMGAAFCSMMKGGNVGKMIVKISD